MDLEVLATRYAEIDTKREAELLRHLNDEGWEAGCWIRPDLDLIVRATRPEMDAFMDELASRPRPKWEIYGNPNPDGLEQTPIDGTTDCFVVLAQRCDIVGPFKTEPLVELASARLCSDKGRIGNSWRNSTREFPIDPDECPTHMVELRHRYWIAKLDLVSLPVAQSLPPDVAPHRVRERFSLRVGQRYTRSAVPDELAVKVEEPLRDLIEGNSELNSLFYEWTLFHGGKRDNRPGIIAVYRVDVDESLNEDERARLDDEIRQRADDLFHHTIEQLPDEAKALLDLDDGHRTRAVPETEYTVAEWRRSWKLEWDADSFGADPEAATPGR